MTALYERTLRQCLDAGMDDRTADQIAASHANAEHAYVANTPMWERLMALYAEADRAQLVPADPQRLRDDQADHEREQIRNGDKSL